MILKKTLIYIGAAVGGLLLLMALYEILKFVFALCILFVVWLPPRRWRW